LTTGCGGKKEEEGKRVRFFKQFRLKETGGEKKKESAPEATLIRKGKKKKGRGFMETVSFRPSGLAKIKGGEKGKKPRTFTMERRWEKEGDSRVLRAIRLEGKGDGGKKRGENGRTVSCFNCRSREGRKYAMVM